MTGEAFSRGPCEVHLLPGAGRWRRACRPLPEGTDGPAEGRLLGAIRRTVGEHLAPRGYRPLTALLDQHIRQHVINFSISPGIVSPGATAPFFTAPLGMQISYSCHWPPAVFILFIFLMLERLARRLHPSHEYCLYRHGADSAHEPDRANNPPGLYGPAR